MAIWLEQHFDKLKYGFRGACDNCESKFIYTIDETEQMHGGTFIVKCPVCGKPLPHSNFKRTKIPLEKYEGQENVGKPLPGGTGSTARLS